MALAGKRAGDKCGAILLAGKRLALLPPLIVLPGKPLDRPLASIVIARKPREHCFGVNPLGRPRKLATEPTSASRSDVSAVARGNVGSIEHFSAVTGTSRRRGRGYGSRVLGLVGHDGINSSLEDVFDREGVAS